MARPVGSKNKPAKKEKSTQATQLSEALAFVSIVGNKTHSSYNLHVVLNNGYAIASDGQITAGYPIVEDLECCPQLALLRSAIDKCGKELSITELDNGSLSIKGEKLKANVPCLPFTEFPIKELFTPDTNIAPVSDNLKAAFTVCGSVVNEAGTRMFETALCLEANMCTATNGKVGVQYWHGINLPPNLIIPKTFAMAVAKQKLTLVGFGFTPGASITLYFDNNAWIRTALYADEYPLNQVNGILDTMFDATMQDVPAGFFEAFATVAEFNDGVAQIQPDRIVSHTDENIGAQYDVADLDGEMWLKLEHMKVVELFATRIDARSHKQRLFFKGSNMRGVVTANMQPSTNTGEDVPF